MKSKPLSILLLRAGTLLKIPFASEASRYRSVLLILFGMVTWLSLQGLDNSLFWGDEAETAFFSKAFINTGKIQGWDGHNLFTWRNGRLMREDLRSVNPPLMFLVTAASFKLMGTTTLAGRLPHVLIGLAVLIVLALLTRELSSSLWFRLYAFSITGFSISFLMFIRNVRYYSLCMLTSVAALYFYHSLLRKPDVRRALALYSACTTMFLSNYLLAVSFIAGLLVYHLVFFVRSIDTARYFRILIPAIPFVSWGLYHSIRYKIWIRLDYVGEPRTWEQFFLRLVFNLRDLEQLVTLQSVVAIAGLILALTLLRDDLVRIIRRFYLLIFVYILVLSSLSLQTIDGFGANWYADIRYLVPLIPLGAICTAALCAFIHRRAPALAVALCALVIFTNLLSLRLADRKPRLLLTEYIREIRNDYIGPYEAALEFVKNNVNKGDTIAVAPPDYQPSMLFYLSDYCQFLGYLQNSAEVRDAAEQLPTPAFEKRDVPDWIACFGYRHGDAWVKYFSQGRHVFGGPPDARVNRWTVPVFHKDMSRPELPWHSFSPVTRFDMNRDAIYFLKRKD